MPLRTRA